MVTIDDIRAAATRIRAFVVRTPLVPALWADDDRPLWLKPENLQPIGAFKIRGAVAAISRLDPAVRARGVLAHSGPATTPRPSLMRLAGGNSGPPRTS